MASSSSIESSDFRLEVLRLCESGMLVLILFTSTPRKVPGARPAMAFEMPQIDIRIVAKETDCTSGAQIMAAAKVRFESAHAVSRVGLRQCVACKTGSRLRGGRAV